MEINSYAIFDASKAVISEGSNAGKTSTISNPTKLRSFNPLIIAIASPLVTPPTSGVPVPGAKAGSTKSTSKERNIFSS